MASKFSFACEVQCSAVIGMYLPWTAAISFAVAYSDGIVLVAVELLKP